MSRRSAMRWRSCCAKEGFEVSVAADGNTAVETFEQEGADLVLLDIMLPGMPGTGCAG